MAKTIRNPEIAAKNWQTRTAMSADFYLSQVEASSWKQYAASPQAEQNYANAMQQVIANKIRQKAIEQVSDEVWKKGVRELGVQRFSQGVNASVDKMNAVMSKLIPDIDNIRKQLPPRGVAGSQENITRMVNFVTTLHKNKGKYKARGVR